MDPRITVVTSVFNGADVIQRCIDSVAGQSYEAREHVVIDGGSTDGTVEILRANSEKLSYCVSENDEGIYDAWNKGVSQAKGDWLVFLGCDDFLWNPESLAGIAPTLASACPAYPVVYGMTVVVGDDGSIVCVIGEPWDKARRSHQWRMSIPNPSTFYHAELFRNYGPFDKEFRVAGDYEFSLRVLLREQALFVDGARVTGFQAGGQSNAGLTALQGLDEIIRARRKNGLSGPCVQLQAMRVRVMLKLAIGRLAGDRALRSLIGRWRTRKYSGQSDEIEASGRERGF